MQIHGDDVIRSSNGQHVGHQFGRDGRTTLCIGQRRKRCKGEVSISATSSQVYILRLGIYEEVVVVVNHGNQNRTWTEQHICIETEINKERLTFQ